jgi:hypothetical protein
MTDVVRVAGGVGKRGAEREERSGAGVLTIDPKLVILGLVDGVAVAA